jgi:hypothetical protein
MTISDNASHVPPRRPDYGDALSRFYGFESYSELCAVSSKLPMHPGDTAETYLACGKDGVWFLWRDEPPPISEGARA